MRSLRISFGAALNPSVSGGALNRKENMNSSTKRCAAAAALAILASATAFSQNPGSSQNPGQSHQKYDVEFVKVVDSTQQGFTGFRTFPSINNHGEVAFVAVQDGVEGVFRSGSERATFTVIASGGGLSNFGDDVSINASGVVAFSATTGSGSRALFKGDGRSKTLVADSAVNGLLKIGVGSPSINASGTVAFFSFLTGAGFPSSVFLGNGGPLTTLATTSKTGFGGFGQVGINDSGTVVIHGTLNDGSEGLFTIRGGIVDIVDTTKHPEFFGFGDPVINNPGTIADFAFRSAGGVEVISGNTRGITPRTDPHRMPPFANSEHPSINNRGAVAFYILSDFSGATDPVGIYLEVSGGHSLIPIVKPGDQLFGSSVAKVTLGRFALNDRFQMAFSYTLSDGRSGIAIASFNGEGEDEGGDQQ